VSAASVLVQVWPPFNLYADKSVFMCKLFYSFSQWQDIGGRAVRPGETAGAVGLDGGIEL